MIELRWKIDPLVKLGGGDEIYDVRRTLQFRTHILQMGLGYQQVGAGDGNTYIGSYERPMGWKWTEWEDVPEHATGSLLPQKERQ